MKRPISNVGICMEQGRPRPGFSGLGAGRLQSRLSLYIKNKNITTDTDIGVIMIKIQFLGTAAAEGWPGVFCECRYCRKARRFGGKNLRTRSSALIDGIYKIDLPADTYWHTQKYGINLAEVEHLFVTHSHNDHYYPVELMHRSKPFAHFAGKRELTVYGSKYLYEYTLDKLGRNIFGADLKFQALEPFKKIRAGEMRVTPIKADHDPNELCFNFIIEYKGRVLLHGHDTGWYPEETWEVLKDYKFDAIWMDCTNGKLDQVLGHIEDGKYHLGVRGVLKTREKLAAIGSLNKNCVFIATHFSHNCGLLHKDFEKIFGQAGIKTAYDGMVVKIAG